MFEQIKSFLKQDDICYVLGDCADRGNDGYKIIKEVFDDDRFVYVKGNHEQLFVSAILSKERIRFQEWFINGGQFTFEDYKKDGAPNNVIEQLQSLPQIATYTNKEGITYIMTHSGYEYDLPDDARNNISNRKHFHHFDEIPENIILIHGHTPSKYLPIWGVKGKKLEFENDNNTGVVYCYNDGHKIDIDCGTVSSKFIVLYCLDDQKIIGFYESNQISIE